jgi:hypothetical protein
LSNAGLLAASSNTLQSFETSFHQDLNGDGVIGNLAGVAGTLIESFGITSLAQVGSNYFFNPVGGGIGPEFSYGGSPVVQGQFAWSLVGVEAITSGYQVAWKSGAQFTVWYTDSTGNYTSNSGVLAASSNSLQSFEMSFHQDLNGDGIIGIPAASAGGTIQSLGSNRLGLIDRSDSVNPDEVGIEKHNFPAENFSFIEASTSRPEIFNAPYILQVPTSLTMYEGPTASYENLAVTHEANAAHPAFNMHNSHYFDSYQADFILR